MIKLGLVKFLTFGLTFVFASSAVCGAGSSQDGERVLRVPYTADVGTFDPDNGFEVGSISAIDSVYEGLVKYSPGSTTIVGSLAESWQTSADGRIYTFHLVEGVKFHDGEPLTAQAVVASFERRKQKGMALGYFLDNVENIEAVDNSEVKITLQGPQASFLDTLASPWGPKIVSPAALKNHDAGDNGKGWLNEHAIGTGPFKLTKFDRGSQYVLERNEDYWGHKPYFNRIQITVVPDISQQILKLRAGEVDVVPTGYPYAQLGMLPENLSVTSIASTAQYALFLKPGTALDDVRVRKAVLAAVNPRAWMSDVFGQYAAQSQSIYPNLILEPGTRIEFPSDMSEAAKVIADKGGLKISIGTFSDTPTYRRISGVLTAQLASIGVDATSYALAPGAAFNLKADPNSPDMLLTIAGPDAADPENQAVAFFTADAPLNFYGRVVSDADELVKQARTVLDPAKRKTIYEAAGRLYYEAGTDIPLVDADDVVVHVKGLTDLGLRPVFPPGNIDFGSVRR